MTDTHDTHTPVELWVKALRSGEYKQTTGLLSDGNGYCCLGVACAVYQKAVGDLDIQVYDHSSLTYYDEQTASLPKKVQDWLGLVEEDGTYSTTEEGNYTSSLANQNDEGATFEEIVTIIESEPSLFR